MSIAFWKKGCIYVRCPHCKNVDPGGSWLAAHSMFDDLVATCVNPKCGKRFDIGKIPSPPKKA